MKTLLILGALVALTSCNSSSSSGGSAPDPDSHPFNKAARFFDIQEEVKIEEVLRRGYACDSNKFSPQVDSRLRVGSFFQLMSTLSSSDANKGEDIIGGSNTIEPAQMRTTMEVFEVSAPKHVGYTITTDDPSKEGDTQTSKFYYDCAVVNGEQKCESSYGSSTQKIAALLTPTLNFEKIQAMVPMESNCTTKGTGQTIRAYLGFGRFSSHRVKAYRIHGQFNYVKTCSDGTTTNGFWVIDGVVSLDIVSNSPNSCGGTVYGYLYQKENEKYFMIQTELEGYKL